MSMREWERRRFVERNPLSAFAAAANVAIRMAEVTVDWDDALPPVAWNGSPERRIRAPHPRNASSLASLLHEVGHQKLHRHKTPAQIGWQGELRACQWALEWWDELDLPDRDQAAFSLGEPLSGYLRLAIEDGTVTMRDIDDEVPGELLPYRPRLVALERQLERQRRLDRGEYVERGPEMPVW